MLFMVFPLMKKKFKTGFFIITIVLIGISFLQTSVKAQTTYGAAATYGLHKVNTSYAGPAMQVRRTCDNAIQNIGFNSCGDLDTIALKNFVVGSNPLSAIAITAAAAYSLRRLSCTYTGKAINVRRSSDNTSQDIGFTSTGDLDTAALKIFVGTGNGFVKIWYDQSGNTRNAIQATNGSQPTIVNAGVVERQNGVPAIYFGGIGFGMATANFTAYNTAACFNGVAKVKNDLTYNTIVNRTGLGGANNYPGPLDFYGNNFLVGNGVAGQYNSFGMSQTFNAARGYSIWTYQAKGTTSNGVNAYCNSASVLSNQTAAYCGDNNTGLYLGSRADALTGLNGWISEVTTFATVLSSADRQYLEWSQGQYYGISGPTYVLPASPASAYVATWYDQTGNGYHVTQATTANQPQIVNAGVIRREGTTPGIYMDGSAYYLSQSTLDISNPYSINTFASRTVNGGSGGYQRLINIGATSDQYGYLGSLGGNFATFVGIGSLWNDIIANVPNTSVALNSSFILSMTAATGASGLNSYLNGAGLTAKNGTTASTTGFLIGGAYTGIFNQLWTGYISELNVFPSALSATRRTLLETTQASYYGTTISNSKYTVASGYNLFVNGIGYSSASDNVTSTSQSTGLGFVSGTTTIDYLKDNGDYITAGTTCPTSALSTLNLPTSVISRWQNDWYIYKTDVNNNGGAIQIYFDYSDYGIAGTPSSSLYYELLGRSTSTGTYAIVPGSYTISGDQIIFTVQAASVSTGYYTLGTSAVPLSVKLLSFTATVNNKEVDLNWVTGTEINNDHFTIERSKDGIHFTPLMEVAGAGNSNEIRNYSKPDVQPYNGVSYYRLKQTDYNGEYSYSSIQTVAFGGNEKSINLYPSPLSKENQQLTVQFEGYKNQDVLVVLRDVNGREFFSKIFIITDDEKSFVINTADVLSAGIYLVIATSYETIRNQKIIVQ